MKKLLILFLFIACLIAFGENGPTPKIVVASSGISDGSVDAHFYGHNGTAWVQLDN